MNHVTNSKKPDTDSSSSDSDDEVDGNGALNRQKRGISCKHYVTKITWPPDQSSSANTSWRNLNPVKPVNVLYGTKMQLFSQTSNFLAVCADGTVKGTGDGSDVHTRLELINAGFPGHVRLQGLLTKLYVAMDRKGRLYGEPDMMEEGTVFVEELQGSYNTNEEYFLPTYFTPSPKYGNKMQLFSKTENFLAIYQDGIKGTNDGDVIYTHLELINAGKPGHVRIRGQETRLYIGMKPDGRLYPESIGTGEETVFIETPQGSYNDYISRKYHKESWYIGLKGNGKIMKGPKTSYGIKAVLFLPLRDKFE